MKNLSKATILITVSSSALFFSKFFSIWEAPAFFYEVDVLTLVGLFNLWAYKNAKPQAKE